MPLCKDACADCSLLHLNKSTAQSKDSAQKGSQRQWSYLGKFQKNYNDFINSYLKKKKVIWDHVTWKLCLNLYCDFFIFFHYLV